METMEAAILACIKDPTGHPTIDRKVLEGIRLWYVSDSKSARMQLTFSFI